MRGYFAISTLRGLAFAYRFQRSPHTCRSAVVSRCLLAAPPHTLDRARCAPSSGASPPSQGPVRIQPHLPPVFQSDPFARADTWETSLCAAADGSDETQHTQTPQFHPASRAIKRPQAGGAGCGGRLWGGACDFSCCVKPRAGIDYTAQILTEPIGVVKRGRS